MDNFFLDKEFNKTEMNKTFEVEIESRSKGKVAKSKSKEVLGTLQS